MQPERAPSHALAPAAGSPLVAIARNSMPAADLSGFRLMPLGLYSLDARLELAKRARSSLDVQYYQIHNDRTGRLFLRTLRDAALRGVRVRLLVDDLYTADGDPLFRGLAAFPNVEVRLFNPFCCGREGFLSRFAASPLEFRRLNRRMHNKLFIADGAMAIAGGRNIGDEYFMRSMSGNFVDMDVFVVGAVVAQLSGIFDTYWNSPYVYPVETIVRSDLGPTDLQRRFDHDVDEGEQMMSLALPPNDPLGYGPIAEDLDAGRVGLIWAKAVAFADPPGKAAARTDEEAREMSVRMNVMTLVDGARTEVIISSPYLVPGQSGLKWFAELRGRSVGVSILTNSLAATDEPVVHTGYARYRPELLKLGVDLYELSPTRIQQSRRLGFPGSSTGRLHAKTVVIDRSVVFVGSMNLDPRSATINTELGIIVQSPALAKEVVRVVHISKLQGAYRLRLGPDGQGLEWLTMDDDREVVLTAEPDTTLFFRLQNLLLAPFVPEQQL